MRIEAVDLSRFEELGVHGLDCVLVRLNDTPFFLLVRKLIASIFVWWCFVFEQDVVLAGRYYLMASWWGCVSQRFTVLDSISVV